MKKSFIIFSFILLLSGISAIAQDTIITKEGDEIIAKVEQISAEEVHYYKYEFSDGPKYVMRIRDVFMIKLSNGTRYVYPVNQNYDLEQVNSLPDYNRAEWYILGVEQAESNFSGLEAFIVSGAVGLLFPIASLPIIIYYGVNNPNIRYDRLQNPDYIKNEEFKAGYYKKAKSKNLLNSILGTLVGISPYILLIYLFSQF